MEKQGNKKRKYLMALCVIAPITAMLILILNRSGVINIGSYLPAVMLLLCPLSHLLMMPLMHKAMDKGHNSEESHHKPRCH